MKEFIYLILVNDGYSDHTHAYAKMPPTEKVENYLQPKITMLCLNFHNKNCETEVRNFQSK